MYCETTTKIKIVDWHKGDIRNKENQQEKVKFNKETGVLLIDYLTENLCRPFLENEEVFFIVELQVPESMPNISLEMIFRTFCKSKCGGIIKSCVDYADLHSKTKFLQSQVFFDDIVIAGNRQTKFVLPNSKANNMKSASEDRVNYLVDNYNLLWEKIHEKYTWMPKDFLIDCDNLVKTFKSTLKQDDMCDTLIGLITIFTKLSKTENHYLWKRIFTKINDGDNNDNEKIKKKHRSNSVFIDPIINIVI